MLERKEHPIASVVVPDLDERLDAERLRRARQAIDAIGEQNRDEDPDEVLRFATEVVEEVRQERHARKQASAPDRR